MKTYKELLAGITKGFSDNPFMKIFKAESPEDALDKMFDLEFPPDKRAMFNEKLVRVMEDYASTYFFAGAAANFAMQGMLHDLMKERGLKIDTLSILFSTFEAFVALLDKKTTECKVFDDKTTATKSLLRVIDNIAYHNEPFIDESKCNCKKCQAKKAGKDPASIFTESMESKHKEDEKTEEIPEEEIKKMIAEMLSKDESDIKIYKLKPEEIPEEVKKKIQTEFEQIVKEARRKQAENN